MSQAPGAVQTDLEREAAALEDDLTGKPAEPENTFELMDDPDDLREPSSVNLALGGELVNGAAALVSSRWPVLSYEQPTKDEAAKHIGRLLDKWLPKIQGAEQWKEEIAAGIFFGMVIASSVIQVMKSQQPAKPAGAPAGGTGPAALDEYE